MLTACLLVLVGSVWPLAKAWQASRGTTLTHTLVWAGLAWLAWAAVVAREIGTGPAGDLGRYLALCLTACAGVSVLGARRPGVGAWSFVVLGLLAVLLLPVAQGLGEVRLQPAHLLFLSVALGVGLGSYLPTRLGGGALLLGLACAIQVARLAGASRAGALDAVSFWLAALSPWLAWASLRLARRPATPFDAAWQGFRDRFGLFWGLRMRDQLNRAAANAGWPVVLGWSGARVLGTENVPSQDQLLRLLHAVWKRFGIEEDIGDGG